MALYPSDHTLHLSSDKSYQGMSFADTLYPSSDDREENLDLQGKEGLPLINKESDKGEEMGNQSGGEVYFVSQGCGKILQGSKRAWWEQRQFAAAATKRREGWKK